MCGVMADMQVILNLIKILMPKIYDILDNKEESCGDFIGNNLINQGLNNLFTNDMLNEETSLLILSFFRRKYNSYKKHFGYILFPSKYIT